MAKKIYPVLDDLKHNGVFYEVSPAMGAKPPEVALTDKEAQPLLDLGVIGPAIGPAPDDEPADQPDEEEALAAALALLQAKGYTVGPAPTLTPKAATAAPVPAPKDDAKKPEK